MKKEMFRRPTRMVHRFGELEGEGPLDGQRFDAEIPRSPRVRSSPALSIKRQGEHRWVDPMSPVVKPGGVKRASLNGPAPDVPDMLAQPIPASTKKRRA